MCDALRIRLLYKMKLALQIIPLQVVFSSLWWRLSLPSRDHVLQKRHESDRVRGVIFGLVHVECANASMQLKRIVKKMRQTSGSASRPIGHLPKPMVVPVSSSSL
ncbi:hypothetical protein B296_00032933 [Ensete ventricosum]|uniref:Uncharacterized protein n=1 Tax=Ensete ventricosum TaxID=4639 RepID=A0A426YRA1_ENSVE|nr:hypothetical protein B296_00032933 [Ensete ventricosum]